MRDNSGSSLEAGRLDAMEQRLCAYLHRLPPGAYKHGTAITSEYGSLFRAHLLHALGAEPDAVRGALNALVPGQASDGFLEISEPVAGGTHDTTYLRFHKSALFFQLADLYDIDVRMPDIDAVFPRERFRSYLTGLDWRNVWLHSNVLLGIATAAHFTARRGGATDLLQMIGEFLIEKRDASGLWGERRGASRLNAMAGTFHLMPILHAAGYQPPAPSATVEAVLSLQSAAGLFCEPSGYSCIEYDAGYLMWAMFPSIGSALRDKVDEAARHLFAAVVDLQNEDGGFPEMGWPRGVMASVAGIADSWSRHHDLGTAVWHLKKIARLYLTPGRPFLNNSTTVCASLPCESNVFSSWLRYLTACVAADVAGIRSFDTSRTCRIVGLNYGGRWGARG